MIDSVIYRYLLIINYLPMQKFLNIFPSTSSVDISPTIDPI